ncbi:MAG: YHS domain-containing protein [Gemmataceae bacterium]|nr:YHS domain-containing protein [Gemmataceae bacterium]
MSTKSASSQHEPTASAATDKKTMALKIGVMGGATGVMSKEHMDKAHQLGRAIAKSGSILITGACPGMPLMAACGAKQEGGMVVGISPGLSLDEHVGKYHSPAEFHDVLIFTGSGLMGREVVNIRSSDIVVIVGGRSGTLGELAIAYDEGRLIGVLTGTGGISDMVRDILAACAKDTGSQVVYDAEPERLIEELLRVYRTSHVRRPSCFCLDRPPGEEGGPKPGMEKDPVCGMEVVPQSAAAERTVAGRRYVFCSAACAARFDADPLKYAPRSKPDA